MRFLILFLILAAQGWGATYYMREDGTAAGKANATSCDAAATAMSVATHNAQAFAAGDTIYLCSDGGEFTAQISVPSSGASGNPITYASAPTQTATIAVAAGAARALYVGGKHYITIRDLTASGGTSQTIYALNASGTTVQDCVLANSNGGTALSFNNIVNGTIESVSASGGTGTVTVSGAQTYAISSLTVTSSLGAGLYIGLGSSATITDLVVNGSVKDGVTLMGGSSASIVGSRWSIANPNSSADVSSAGLRINLSDQDGYSIALSDIAITGSGRLGAIVYSGTAAHSLANGSTISESSITGSASDNLRLSKATGLALASVVLSGSNTGHGLNIVESSSVTADRLTVQNNALDGIDLASGGTGSITNSVISGNGQLDAVSSGDGISAHLGSAGIVISYNLIYANRNSGIAHVNDSSGTIYNNVIYGNGDPASVNMGVRGGYYASGTTSWTLKNNIFQGNYPYEINVGATDTIAADHNLYLHQGNSTVEANCATLDNGGTVLAWAAYAANEAHSVYGDPRFRSTSDFHLLPSSPAINAGVDVGLTTDIEGKAIRGLPDIGAYEFQKTGGVSKAFLLRSGRHR